MYRNKHYFLAALVVIYIINSGLQCNKHIGCADAVYNFEMGIKAFPDNESIRIGDTVWLALDEPTTQTDLQTGRMIDYSNASNLGTAISMAELLSANNINTEANSFFKFTLIIGSEVPRPDTNKFKEYSFAETNNHYKFQVAIIPMKVGVYKIFISNAANVYRKNNRCTKADFGINFKNTNQHLYLNEIVLPGVVLPSGGGVYLFKVY